MYFKQDWRLETNVSTKTTQDAHSLRQKGLVSHIRRLCFYFIYFFWLWESFTALTANKVPDRYQLTTQKN